MRHFFKLLCKAELTSLSLVPQLSCASVCMNVYIGIIYMYIHIKFYNHFKFWTIIFISLYGTTNIFWGWELSFLFLWTPNISQYIIRNYLLVKRNGHQSQIPQTWGIKSSFCATSLERSEILLNGVKWN